MVNQLNMKQIKTELVLAALTAPQGTRIQVFRNKKGEISWSTPQTNSWIADPDEPRKEHPDTIGWIQACGVSDLADGIVWREDGKIGLNAEIWGDWMDVFGEPVQGEYYDRELVVSLEKLLDEVVDLVESFELGFELEDSPSEEQEEA